MKYLLNIYDQGETYNIEFNTFTQLKNHLIKYTNLYFGWINNNKDESTKIDLPNFNSDYITSVEEINDILEKYNNHYCYMKVIKVKTKKFIELLKEKRLKLGLTQKQVSRALNLSAEYYQQIELGINKPGYRTFLSLAKLLNIDLGELSDELKNINLHWAIFARNKGEPLSDYKYITPEGKAKDHLSDAVLFDDINEVIKIAKDAKKYFDIVEWELVI